MSAATGNNSSPRAAEADAVLINSDPTADEDSKVNNITERHEPTPPPTYDNDAVTTTKDANNDNNDKSVNNSNDDLDENEIPEIVFDKRKSNMIVRRHSADLKNLDSKIEIKITGASIDNLDSEDPPPYNTASNNNDDDSKHLEGSEDADLKMLGPIQDIVKTQSLDTGLSNRKETESLHADELFSAREPSIVKFEETDNVSGRTVVQTAVVPPRQVIERYPFFSTPLTVESTNNAFRDFLVRLQAMGFAEQAEAALVHTNAESIEAAVTFITDDPDRLWHRFKVPPSSLLNPAAAAAPTATSNNPLLTSPLSYGTNDTTSPPPAPAAAGAAGDVESGPNNANIASASNDSNISNMSDSEKSDKSDKSDKNDNIAGANTSNSPNNSNILNNNLNSRNAIANDLSDADVNITDSTLCDACGMAYSAHLIDHKGEQIVPQEERLFGSLIGRTSMSVATLQHRQDQRQLVEEAKRRAHALVALVEGGIDGLDDDLEVSFKASESGLISEKIKSEMDSMLKEEQEKKKTIDGPTEMCKICFDDKSVDDFYRAPCGHNYCKDCLQTHYKIKTKDGDVLKVSCIDPECDREIPEEECRQFLTDPEVLAKYEKFRRDKLIMLNPSARFCPKPDCPGHMTGSRWNPRLTCPVCSEEVCFNCSQRWHGYFVGCNQNVDIGYSRWAINKDVQKCPKCRIRIEKAEGCNHMTCQSCHYEFCWICRGPYSSSHYDPWNIFGCPGAQFTPRFCRCPSCFPRWLNRVLILICFFAVVVPLVIAAGSLWLVVLFLIFCIRCDAKCDIDPCDCFD